MRKVKSLDFDFTLPYPQSAFKGALYDPMGELHALGPYRFSLTISAYQTLKCSIFLYRWPSIEYIDQEPLLQAVKAHTNLNSVVED